MASLVKDLVEAGIHFGHRATNWNPKMAPYIFGKRNKIHIVDVKETIKGLLLARKFITQTVAKGKDVLFVGTKRQARGILEQHVPPTGMHHITERWLGGTLTNFRTIRDRLKRLEELEALEESGEILNYSKKMESQIRREKEKIQSNLGGIRHMHKLPGAMVVIDVNHEHNAVREARKLGIPTVCLIDTDSDPDYADIPIPGNDDAMRAIEVVVQSLCAAAAEGKTARAQQQMDKQGEQAPGGDQQSQRRRSRRAQFRAEDAAEPAPGEQPAQSASSASPPSTEDAGPGEQQETVASAAAHPEAPRTNQTNPPQ